jgi:hypothetical protein
MFCEDVSVVQAGEREEGKETKRGAEAREEREHDRSVETSWTVVSPRRSPKEVRKHDSE